MKILTLKCLATFAIPFIFFLQAAAQGATSAGIEGKVYDAVTNAPLAAAKVSLTNKGSGSVFAVITNNSGAFVKTNLPPGEYDIEITAVGYKPYQVAAKKLFATAMLPLLPDPQLQPVSPGQVPLSDERKAVMAVINQFVDGFNKGDAKSAVAACAPETSIIDEFPPHEWHGKGACMAWVRDYDIDAKRSGITDGVVTLGPSHLDVTGNYAYAVIPSNYVFKMNGKEVSEIGSMFTFALQKSRSAWRITGWAWSKK
jgi:hypothetical protein